MYIYIWKRKSVWVLWIKVCGSGSKERVAERELYMCIYILQSMEEACCHHRRRHDVCVLEKESIRPFPFIPFPSSLSVHYTSFHTLKCHIFEERSERERVELMGIIVFGIFGWKHTHTHYTARLSESILAVGAVYHTQNTFTRFHQYIG